MRTGNVAGAEAPQVEHPRVAVITGGSSGVGRATAALAVRAGMHVVIVSRDRGRGEAARTALDGVDPRGRVALELVDLADLAGVRDLARRLSNGFPELDVLVANAGVYRARRERTGDGLERTMATNHLGHFALATGLVEPLARAGGRIVTVSSEGHRSARLRRAPLDDILTGEAWKGGIQAYCDSKLANVLFSFEAARRLAHRGIGADAVHPGVLSTRIWNQNANPLSLLVRMFKPFMASPRSGGEAVFELAVGRTSDGTGRYLDRRAAAQAAPDAYDEALAADLWETSRRIVDRVSREGG